MLRVTSAKRNSLGLDFQSSFSMPSTDQLAAKGAAESSSLIADSEDKEQRALQVQFQGMFKTAGFAVCMGVSSGAGAAACGPISDLIGTLGKAIGTIVPAARGTNSYIFCADDIVDGVKTAWAEAVQTIQDYWNFMTEHRGLGKIPFSVRRSYLRPLDQWWDEPSMIFNYEHLIRCNRGSGMYSSSYLPDISAHPTLATDGPYGGYADTPERALIAYAYSMIEGWGPEVPWSEIDFSRLYGGDRSRNWQVREYRDVPGSVNDIRNQEYVLPEGGSVDIHGFASGYGPFGTLYAGFPLGCDEGCTRFARAGTIQIWSEKLRRMGNALSGVSRAIDDQIKELLAKKKTESFLKVLSLSAGSPSVSMVRQLNPVVAPAKPAVLALAKPAVLASAKSISLVDRVSAVLHDPKLVWAAAAAFFTMFGVSLWDRQG
jgi:hypothetical protein